MLVRADASVPSRGAAGAASSNGEVEEETRQPYEPLEIDGPTRVVDATDPTRVDHAEIEEWVRQQLP